jgi:hypothetical protein
MALSDREKEMVIDYLEEMSDAARVLVLASLEAFTEWLANVLYSIYAKIRDALGRLWQWLRSKF